MARAVPLSFLALLAAVSVSAIDARTSGLNFIDLLDTFDQKTAAVFSPDSKLLATAGVDGTYLYAFKSENVPSLVASLQEPDGHYSLTLAFSPDSKLLASGVDNGKVTVYSLEGESVTPSLQYTLDEAEEGSLIYSVAFSRDGRFLASGSSDHIILLYSLSEGSAPILEHSLEDSNSYISSVAFSADSKLLAAGSWDNKVRVYALEAGQAPRLQYVLDDAADFVYSVAFSDDCKYLMSGTADNNGASPGYTFVYNMHDVESGVVEPVVLDEATRFVGSVAFSPGARFIATGSEDSKVRVYEFKGAAPTLKYTLEDATYAIGQVSFSDNGKYLVSSSGDAHVRMYFLESGAPQAPVTADDVAQAALV